MSFFFDKFLNFFQDFQSRTHILLYISQILSDFEKPGLFGELLCCTIKIYQLKAKVISSSGSFFRICPKKWRKSIFLEKNSTSTYFFRTESASKRKMEILSCQVFLVRLYPQFMEYAWFCLIPSHWAGIQLDIWCSKMNSTSKMRFFGVFSAYFIIFEHFLMKIT